MNFKDEFNKECHNITASDELINRTLMAAMTQDYNETDNDNSSHDNDNYGDNNSNSHDECNHSNSNNHDECNHSDSNSDNHDECNHSDSNSSNHDNSRSSHDNGKYCTNSHDKNINSNDINNNKKNNYRAVSHPTSKKKKILHIIASAAAITIICFAAYSIYSITRSNNHNNSSNTSTAATPVLKVYAGENNEELGTRGLSLAYSKDSAYGMTNIFGWGNDNVLSITTLQFNLNIQLTGMTSSIKRITLTSSSPYTNILTTSEVPEEIINNNYKITEDYGREHSLYRSTDESPYSVRSKYDSNEKYIYIDHKNTYSSSFSDFENLYLNFKLSNTNSVSTQLVLSVEYEDGSIVNKAYQATAYASELYMFIREVK